MKKTLLSHTVALLMSLSVFAQLPKGSVAPDFTVRDLVNNQPYNLYTFLNNGYTVYIDVSAAWCGPCWNYHNQHHLEALYKHHGPTGLPGVDATTTNDVMVFYIEGESTNTHAQLYGTTSGTAHSTFSQGNWIAGTPYPVIDTLESWFDTNYSIAYFPTIYKICRDRLIEEVGQIDSTALYAYVAGCPSTAPTASVDAKMALGSYSQSYFCGNTLGANVTFQNYSTNNLTAANIEVYNGATLITTQPWTGSLATYAVTTVNIPSISVTSSSFPTTLDFKVVATGDAVSSNDLLANNKVVDYATTNSTAIPTLQDFESFATTSGGPANYVYGAGIFFYDGIAGSPAVMGSNGSNTKCTVIPYPSMPNSSTVSTIASNFNTTTSMSHLTLSFDIAHAFAGTENDEFEALLSTNCGATWTSVLKLTGKTGATSFSTAPDNPNAATTSFLPASAGDWANKTVDISSYKNNTNLLLKFNAILGTGQSDYAFLDNVRIDASNTALGVDNISTSGNVDIYPNPSEGNFNVVLNLTSSQNVKIDVINTLGQTISSTTKTLQNGVVALDLNEVATGSYFVKITTSNETITKKIVKE